MTPFEVERRCYYDVIGLYKDVRTMQIREKKQEKEENTGREIIRRPAGDDWF